MTRNDPADRERASRLMMAALDGEISATERQELDQLLETDDRIRDEWERMNRVKEVTSTMAFREPPEEVWEQYWTSVYNRVERGIGWILLSLGTIVLLAYGAWKWMEAIAGADDLPLVLKLAIFGGVVGLIILIVSVLREKLFTRRRDAYKEIQR